MKKFEIDFLDSYDDDSILNELKRIVAVTGKETITKKDVENIGRVSFRTISNRFGSLRKASEKINLKPNRLTKATDEELLHILVELWEQTLEKEGRSPYQTDLKTYGFPVSRHTMAQRFGSWRKALRRAFDSVNEETIKAEEVSYSSPQKIVAQKPLRKALSLRKRFFVLKRDQFTCQLCGKSGVGVRLEVDHKVSVYDGGTDALDNLWTMCFECNRGKSKTSL
jgi:HNH endonuclease/Homing endonuclease associated repeat